MKSRGALVWGPGPTEWVVEDLILDDPKEGEALVRLKAAGLCHSDAHLSFGDQSRESYPFLGGHEGAGIVEKVGPGVTSLAVGDHVTTTFMPSCGTCAWCVKGRGNLCDRGAELMSGYMLDGTHRIHTAGGDPVGPMTFLGTFSEYIVSPVESLIKIDKDIPFEAAAITACAVPTGWGTAVNIAGVQPDDVVMVIGVGGVGMSAVQGARMAGAREIIVVDPAEFKRQQAPRFGATHVAADLEEAQPLVQELTRGVGVDRAILTMGVVDADLIQPILNHVSKGGVLAIGGVSAETQTDAKLGVLGFVLLEQQIRGGIYGGCQPAVDVPRLLGMYKRGALKLDEMVTRTYKLEQINEAYKHMAEGSNIRGVIVYD
ncbi:NDMA-dependent alcohol dehydrogenase [Streptomyces brasiliensis]|uniref:Alcohol dehydrogenase n=1 Tax=Streptomyces brasiliensis TaxID=1954 RepID=A0A917KZW3_9ACTN|nr:NDMA-dependent alcohol dehydrogenase [Streptomyces brasiliensis]GGJ35328.1 alcohol dehydrogenase [Streptomyces brasiliensis]